ncbi:glycogen/starch/alpha-glucan phosphorylase, partial [Planctomycetota bacterium]
HHAYQRRRLCYKRMQVSTLWHDQQTWTRRSIINVAHMGKFSSDRSIRDYCRQVWKVQPMHVRMEAIEPHVHSG